MCRFQTPKNCFFSCGHVKTNFHVLNNFTKKNTRQNTLGFRGDGALLAKLLKSKVGIESRRPSKALSKSSSCQKVRSNCPSPFSPAKPLWFSSFVVARWNTRVFLLYYVLPCLKTLHLTNIWLPGGLRDFMLFLTGCPLLEYLSTQIVSVSDDKSLTCNEWKSSFLTKLARAEIDCYNHYFHLKAVYNVGFLRDYFYQGYYHDDLIPTFHNLTDLELTCYDYSKEFLLDVLNNCPKLQRFTLEEMCIYEEEVCARKDDKVNWVFPDVVPQCLSLHLRTCNLSGFLGLHGELMLVRYILKNARVLQTMKIWNSGQPEIKRILSEFPRASATCELTCNHW